MQRMSKPNLESMNEEQLRAFAASLFSELESKEAELQGHRSVIEAKDRQIQVKDLTISKLSHEMAVLKRWRFGKASEAFHGLHAACWKSRSTKTWAPSRSNWMRAERRRSPRKLPCELGCQSRCRGSRCLLTSRSRRYAAVAAR